MWLHIMNVIHRNSPLMVRLVTRAMIIMNELINNHRLKRKEKKYSKKKKRISIEKLKNV